MNEKALKEFEKYLDEWTSTPMGRRAFLASVGVLMAACATTEKSRYREGDNAGQDTSLSVAEEKRMTQEVMPQMRKDYPLAQNPEFQNYLNQVGRRVVAANQLEGNPYNYNFSVVDVNYVNAFALPAGTIMVTVPLLAMAESEAELAGVIGHEIGHVKARHTAERMDKAKREQSKSWKYALGGGVLGGVLGYGIGKLACPPKDKDCLSKATELGATAGVGGGLLVQKYAFMANSREDEMEADRIGFRTSLTAGYDKDHVGRFYSKLLEMEGKSGGNKGALKSLSDALSTHPPSQERVNQMNQMSGEARNTARTVVSTKEFDRIRSLAEKSKKS
jgi:predicted Zn-dependent protease